MQQPLTYCGMPLDRKHFLRADAKWVARQLECADAQFLPVWRDDNLFCDGAPVFLAQARAEDIVAAASEIILLGSDGQDAPVFALDLSHLDEADVAALVTERDATFQDLRLHGPQLPADKAATLGYARGITHWHRQNKFCSACGGETQAGDGGYSRRCCNKTCARQVFPRINPAVIMLVEQSAPHGDAKCLLACNRQWQNKNVYSTLAGYVEVGESLEAAVAREVREETGIEVARVNYFTSQPWPFPANIMLGFHACTDDTDITIAKTELADARWFTATEIKDFGEYGDADGTGGTGKSFALPRRDSIARTLIEDWLQRNPAK